MRYNVLLCEFTTGGEQTNGLHDYLRLFPDCFFGMIAGHCARELL